MIHGVDSYNLLTEINKQAEKAGKKVNCLLQIHIASEETKFGFSEDELLEMLRVGEWKGLKNIKLCGLMGMATFTENRNQIRSEFKLLKLFFEKIKQQYFGDIYLFTEISMGMSDDYEIAIEEGSTMIRVGSRIFGDRVY